MAVIVEKPSLEQIAEKSGLAPEQVAIFLEIVKRSMEPLEKNISVVENNAEKAYRVTRLGVGPLITEYGKFWQYSFTIDDVWQKYSVIVKGGINHETLTPVFKHKESLIVRTDSGCETGQMFGDKTCECCEQLMLTMKTISEAGEGLIVNIPRQDGRGMGLTFKLATLWLQDELNVNTVESAGLLAHDGIIDIRTYSGVICILKFFGIDSSCIINLATNNPKKVSVFFENGYKVNDELVPVIIEPTKHTLKHLQAKEACLHHIGLCKETGYECR